MYHGARGQDIRGADLVQLQHVRQVLVLLGYQIAIPEPQGSQGDNLLTGDFLIFIVADQFG